MFAILIGSIIFNSCVSEEPMRPKANMIVAVEDEAIVVEIDTSVQQSLRPFNLVDIVSIDSSILVDLKYATSDNFMGFVLYDTLNSVTCSMMWQFVLLDANSF